MAIHTYTFTSRALRGTHEELKEMARVIAAVHFGECPVHFNDFDSIIIDYSATENEDGSVTSVTTAVVEYSDYDDDDDDFGLSGVLASTSPTPTIPPVKAEIDPLSNNPFFNFTAFFAPA